MSLNLYITCKSRNRPVRDYCHVRRRQEYIKRQSKKRKATHELLANKMDEAEVRTRKIETELNQEKTDYLIMLTMRRQRTGKKQLLREF